MEVSIRTFVTGPFSVNTYIVACNGQCWVVDPGAPDSRLKAFINESNLSLTAIVLTHGHGDHIAGTDKLLAEFDGAQLICPAEDAEMLGDPAANLSQMLGFPLTIQPPDTTINPGQTLTLGSSSWQVLDTSGHTPGGVSYYCSDAGAIIVGDALFAGSIGRCDLPRASQDQLVANIREYIYPLPDETRVLPGHGPETTVGVEKRTNPFVTSR